MKTSAEIILLVGFLFVGLVAPLYAGVPPRGSMPASEIVRSIEMGGHGVLKSIEFDDGLWEAEVCKTSCTKLYIKPDSAKIERTEPEDMENELPPQGSLPLSKILASVEGQNAGRITKAEFDDGVWEVEVRRKGSKRELKINPKTGEPNR